MAINRRDFLKAAGGGALIGSSSISQARPNKEPPPEAIGMLYDATLCIGCKACMVACKDANDMPVESNHDNPLWDTPADISGKTINVIKVYRDGDATVKDREKDGYSFVKRHCMHCVDAGCVSVCPVSAMRKDPTTGVVTHHEDVCIGCRYCVYACPYNVPKFDFDGPFGKINKCQFCHHRLAVGLLPACVAHCPTGASLFGTREEMLAEAQRRLSMEPGTPYDYPRDTLDAEETHPSVIPHYQPRIYGETQGGGTQVLMLSGVPFEKLDLPTLPEQSFAARSENVQHTVYKYMMAPVALFAGLTYMARRNLQQHTDPESESEKSE